MNRQSLKLRFFTYTYQNLAVCFNGLKKSCFSFFYSFLKDETITKSFILTTIAFVRSFFRAFYNYSIFGKCKGRVEQPS